MVTVMTQLALHVLAMLVGEEIIVIHISNAAMAFANSLQTHVFANHAGH